MQYWGSARFGTVQNVAYTGTAGTTGTAVSVGVNRVRIAVTTDAFIVIGQSPTATTSGVLFPAGTVEYVTVSPGEKVSAIQSSAGGTLSVVEAL